MLLCRGSPEAISLGEKVADLQINSYLVETVGYLAVNTKGLKSIALWAIKKKKKSVRKKKEDAKSFLLLLKNRVVSFSLVANAIFRCVWKRQKHSCFVNSGILTHTVCNLANINNRLNYLCLQYFLEPQGVLPVRCYWGPLKAKPVHRCSAPCACYWLSAVLFTSSPCNWHFSLPNWPVQSACHISGTEMPEYPEVPCSGFSFFFFFPIFIPLVDTTLF